MLDAQCWEGVRRSTHRLQHCGLERGGCQVKAYGAQPARRRARLQAVGCRAEGNPRSLFSLARGLLRMGERRQQASDGKLVRTFEHLAAPSQAGQKHSTLLTVLQWNVRPALALQDRHALKPSYPRRGDSTARSDAVRLCTAGAGGRSGAVRRV